MIERSDFFGYEKYVIRAGGLAVSVLTLGAAVCSIEYNGRPVALGYGTAQEYLDCESRAGAIIGRVAGRVAHARFSLGGREYPLAANDGENQLHGGPQSFDKRRWSAEVQCANRIRFALLSREGDNGYPGALAAAVSYSVDNDTLRINFEAEASADTPFAPTSHIYFNLGGTPDILGTHLAVNAQQYQPLDAAGLPQGAPAPTAGDYDFSELRPIGRDYDDCFLLAGKQAAMAEDGGVGVAMRTDFPALMLYTGAGLSAPLHKSQGFCLEPSFGPDCPNRPDAPILHRGERFHRYAEYRFYRRSGGQE